MNKIIYLTDLPLDEYAVIKKIYPDLANLAIYVNDDGTYQDTDFYFNDIDRSVGLSEFTTNSKTYEKLALVIDLICELYNIGD